jgi:hypothetical protein
MVTERDSLPAFLSHSGKNLQMFPRDPFYQVRRCFTGNLGGAMPSRRYATGHRFAIVYVFVLRGESGGHLLVFG